MNRDWNEKRRKPVMLNLRPFCLSRNFGLLQNWVPDERTHALWCAGRFPLQAEDARQVLLRCAAAAPGIFRLPASRSTPSFLANPFRF